MINLEIGVRQSKNAIGHGKYSLPSVWYAREEMMYRMVSCYCDPILTVHPGNPMLQQSLLIEDNNGEQSQKQRHSLGNDLYLELSKGSKGQAILYRQGGIIKSVALSDKVAKQLFLVESVNLGAQPTKLSSVLKISRQTIHNYRESYRYFGAEGLIYGYNPDISKNHEKQRALHSDQLPRGNKAEQVATIRAKQKELEAATTAQKHLDFSFGDNDRTEAVSNQQQPFAEQHEWESSRYAGVFIYWIVLLFQSRWLQLIIGHFGAGWRIFSVFLLMAGLNIRSIEQTKHLRSREAGVVLGLGTVPSKSTLWKWFYDVSAQGLARRVLDDYFRRQIRTGVVGYGSGSPMGTCYPIPVKKRSTTATTPSAVCRYRGEPVKSPVIIADASSILLLMKAKAR
ncbi:MAG: hypothetical protein GQ538_09310 [Xanthomonadales bacterium]|nr:hypothetical protein [Xanthomonadales bacterium]